MLASFLLNSLDVLLSPEDLHEDTVTCLLRDSDKFLVRKQRLGGSALALITACNLF